MIFMIKRFKDYLYLIKVIPESYNHGSENLKVKLLF